MRGYLDRVEVKEIKEFESRMLTDVKANHPEFLEEIRNTKAISEELDKKLTDFFENFTSEFHDEEKAA